jgi:hypothetical protein
VEDAFARGGVCATDARKNARLKRFQLSANEMTGASLGASDQTLEPSGFLKPDISDTRSIRSKVGGLSSLGVGSRAGVAGTACAAGVGSIKTT